MENKTGKYFKYAIGEIILVVIGILIALQINNWNENKLNHKKEVTILNALKTEFEENSNRYIKTIELQERVLKSSNSLMQCIEKKDLNFKRDSIGYFILDGALNYYRAEPILGTYQALNGSGDINIIQNTLLKSKLAFFSSEIIQGFEDETASMNLFDQLAHEFSDTLEPLMSDSERKRYGLKQVQNLNAEYQNNTLSKLYQNPNILVPLTLRFQMEYNRLSLQKKMLKLSNEILNLLNTELE